MNFEIYIKCKSSSKSFYMMSHIVGKKSGIPKKSEALCGTVRSTLQLMEPCSDGATDSNNRCNTE